MYARLPCSRPYGMTCKSHKKFEISISRSDSWKKNQRIFAAYINLIGVIHKRCPQEWGQAEADTCGQWTLGIKQYYIYLTIYLFNLKLYLRSITNRVQRIIEKNRVEKRRIVKYKMPCL